MIYQLFIHYTFTFSFPRGSPRGFWMSRARSRLSEISVKGVKLALNILNYLLCDTIYIFIYFLFIVEYGELEVFLF